MLIWMMPEEVSVSTVTPSLIHPWDHWPQHIFSCRCRYKHELVTQIRITCVDTRESFTMFVRTPAFGRKGVYPAEVCTE